MFCLAFTLYNKKVGHFTRDMSDYEIKAIETEKNSEHTIL